MAKRKAFGGGSVSSCGEDGGAPGFAPQDTWHCALAGAVSAEWETKARLWCGEKVRQCSWGLLGAQELEGMNAARLWGQRLGPWASKDFFSPTSPLFVRQVACGQDHSLFLTDKGEVYSCGWGADGQTGSVSPTPEQCCTVVPQGSHGRVPAFLRLTLTSLLASWGALFCLSCAVPLTSYPWRPLK